MGFFLRQVGRHAAARRPPPTVFGWRLTDTDQPGQTGKDRRVKEPINGLLA
jgi:hypothetical protein